MVRTIIDFNAKWAFTKDTEELPKKLPEKWCWVNLPHTWNAIDGQDGGADYYRGKGYYAKEFDRQELPKAEWYYLEINGANSSADVYLNGEKKAHHDGGYSTFRINLTEGLKEHNLLVIVVDNSANEQVYPQNADFTFYGGLYRDVKLIGVNSSHFDLEYYGSPGLMVTPEISGHDGQVQVKAFLAHAKEGQRVSFQIKDKEGNIVEKAQLMVEREQNAAEIVFSMKAVHLWNGRKDPYLYTVEAFLMEDDRILDNVSARFGFRSFEIHPENGFILNGKSYPLRGVSRHQDRWGVGNALLPEHHREDMKLICELGATTIRLAHYQHDQYFYDLCDEAGMVVWAEIPYISTHMAGGRENTLSQMKELILQNYNHPCIVVWGLSNEITMGGKTGEDLLENHRLLNNLAHELDSTRLTTIAVLTMCDIHDPYLQIPDVVSYNHYFGWYGGDTSMNGPWFDNFHREFPNIPIGCSEYGCEALNWHTSEPMQGDYTEEYQAFYHEELIKQLFSRHYLWATHVWNMFDFGADARNEGGENGQNHKGLVTFDRKYKKDAFYAYKAWLSEEAFVHICGKRYVDRVEEETKVTVYSNQPEVELFANDISLGKQKSPEHFFYFTVPNQGETRLKAVAGDCEDYSVIRKVDTFNEAYRLKEKGAILNWFDITEKEGYYSLNDKLGDVLQSSKGKQLLASLMKLLMGNGKDGETGFFHPDQAEGMMKMLGSFTVIRLLNTFGAMNESLTKEQLLGLNAQLNQIEKEEKSL